jgi:hypothetical protein
MRLRPHKENGDVKWADENARLSRPSFDFPQGEHHQPQLGVDARTTRYAGYVISQQKRKRTEEPLGWAKPIGGLARPMLRGVACLRFQLTMAAYDLIRLPKLLGASG